VNPPTPAGLGDVYARIEAGMTTALDQLAELIRIPGVSAAPTDDLARCADAVRSCMEASGLEARLLEGHGPAAVFGQRLVDPALPTVLIYGHYDVQPADSGPEWHTPPFDPVLRDGRIYGRGSSDNKGQHLAQLWALRAILDTRGELPVNVKVLVEGEEEIGSPHLSGLVREHRDLLSADVAITSDGPVHRSGRPQLVLGTRGQLGVELRARGANQDAHSGSLGGLLPDPGWQLIHALSVLRAPSGEVTVPGFSASVRPPTPDERRRLAELPLDLADHLAAYDIAELPPPTGPGYYDRLMLQPTMTVTGLSAGYCGPGVKTVLPSHAVARLDMRLVPDQHPDEIFGLLQRHLAAHDSDVELVRLSAVPPSRTPVDDPYVARVADAVAQATGQRPLIVPSLGSTLPNFVFTEILAMPSVLVPYANPDQNNHAPNENFVLSRFADGMRICAAILDEMGRTAR
jgi:acetylornithine deacetylase/succinyl-diaminopimelate desuccinylase-like protein